MKSIKLIILSIVIFTMYGIFRDNVHYVRIDRSETVNGVEQIYLCKDVNNQNNDITLSNSKCLLRGKTLNEVKRYDSLKPGKVYKVTTNWYDIPMFVTCENILSAVENWLRIVILCF